MTGRKFLRRGAPAFTILELLGTISILAILAALLVPAIAKMTAKAQTAKCLSNLRELGAAWHAFANDNGGRLASVAWKNPSSNAEPGLRDYLGLPGDIVDNSWRRQTVFTCPVLQSVPATATQEDFLRTYGVNEFASDVYTGSVTLHKRRLAAINRPSQYAVAMDGTIAPGNAVSELYSKTCSNRQGKEQWVQQPHGTPAAKGANVLFADGHVAFTPGSIILDNSATSVFWRDPAN